MLRFCFFFLSYKNDYGLGVVDGVRKRGVIEISDRWGDCKRYRWKIFCLFFLRMNYIIFFFGYNFIGSCVFLIFF